MLRPISVETLYTPYQKNYSKTESQSINPRLTLTYLLSIYAVLNRIRGDCDKKEDTEKEN